MNLLPRGGDQLSHEKILRLMGEVMAFVDLPGLMGYHISNDE